VPPPLPGWVDERLSVATPENMLLWARRLVNGPSTLELIFLS